MLLKLKVILPFIALFLVSCSSETKTDTHARESIRNIDYNQTQNREENDRNLTKDKIEIKKTEPKKIEIIVANHKIINDSDLDTKSADFEDTLIKPKHISLSVNVPTKLITTDDNLILSSNSPYVSIDKNGYLTASVDKLGDESQVTITAMTKDGSSYDRCKLTIVKWRANLSSLTIASTIPHISNLLTKNQSKLYFSYGSKLYYSEDALESRTLVSKDFPTSEDNPFFLKTQYYNYVKSSNRLFETDQNLVTYEEVATNTSTGHATEHNGLKHAFAYDIDNHFIYAGEYTTDSSNFHSVYRGTVSPTGLKEWKKIYEFDSADSKSVNSVLHIHVVTVDPYTGTLWVGTGDSDDESRLYYSKDHGESWELFAIGAQYYRILSMWFTKDYIYWNTDSAKATQVISRVKRTNMGKNLTPRLENGKTKIGVNYFVYKSDGTLPSKREVYTEEEERQLDQNNIVYAVDDEQYDYREVVAVLNNGSHWYHLWVKDEKGEDLVIMTTAPEGTKRDKRARIFGIKEKSDGNVDVQELYSFGKEESDPYSSHMQLVPGFQDDDGYIYFRGRSTKRRIYKMKLHWVDK